MVTVEYVKEGLALVNQASVVVELKYNVLTRVFLDELLEVFCLHFLFRLIALGLWHWYLSLF